MSHPFRSRPGSVAALAAAGIVATLLVADPAAAQRRGARTAPIRTGLENVEKQVQEFTLANGLRFIVVERHQAPVFHFFTIINSGSSDDQVGTTGLAHMMEHMAFKGTTIVGTKDWAAEKPLMEAEDVAWQALLTERRRGARADTAALRRLERAYVEAQDESRRHVASNEFTQRLEQAGAQGVNAFTSNDITAYFYSIPSNRLELWAMLQAGQVADPVFREFYKERDVVYEERRMRTESSPIGKLYNDFIQTAYAAHPYGFGGIGHPSDLKSFSRDEGEAFFRRTYVAKNMTIAIVGDVKLAEVKRLAEKYFGKISDAPAPPPLDTVEPEQRAERRVILEDPAQPLIMMGWHIPAASDPSYPAFEAVADLLAGGDHARLNKALVKEEKVATTIESFANIPGQKYPTLLGLFVVPASGQDPVALEGKVHDVIGRVMSDQPFTAAELDGYKVRVKASKIGQAGSSGQLAFALANAQVLHGDWRQFFREQERVQALTVADLQAAMQRAIKRSNRTVAMIVNPASTSANEGGR